MPGHHIYGSITLIIVNCCKASIVLTDVHEQISYRLHSQMVYMITRAFAGAGESSIRYCFCAYCAPGLLSDIRVWVVPDSDVFLRRRHLYPCIPCLPQPLTCR